MSGYLMVPQLLPQKKKTARRGSTKATKSKKPAAVDYTFRIDRWAFVYHFGMETWKPSLSAPWSEIMQLRLFGEIIEPVKLKRADREILIFADRSILPLEGQPYKHAPPAGHFTYVGREPKIYLKIPIDMLPVVIQMLCAGRYKSVKFKGSENETGDPIVVQYEFRDTNSNDTL
jgi:hypothetical protein